ncbi:hypothetical protein MHBO_002789 [Bonamia ostreae]|uniref:Uncharacterized protein n=1 Tax=Bonamia ostreae TaxID=126728 RepID=A0ABV2ANK3_9EUKA
MTTAHKPTFHPAVGTANQGGYRYPVRSFHLSALDLPAHKELKKRKIGQNTAEEIKQRDLLAELEMREKAHEDKLAIEKRREKPQLEQTRSKAIKAGKSNFEEELEDRTKNFDDADSYDSSTSETSESDDEEKELMAELEKIKKERKQEKEDKLENPIEKDKLNKAIEENPLLFGESFAVKARWDHDIVFRNQSRDEPKDEPRFINDTIRNDFHKKFIRKYVR